jgi:hypothetical protein
MSHYLRDGGTLRADDIVTHWNKVVATMAALEQTRS